jgi:uncharacterized coiled-coil protein SlyX
MESSLKELTQLVGILVHRSDALEAKMDALINTRATKGSIFKVDKRLDSLELKVDNLEKRIDRLEVKLDQNTVMLGSLGDDVAVILRKVATHDDAIRELRCAQ